VAKTAEARITPVGHVAPTTPPIPKTRNGVLRPYLVAVEGKYVIVRLGEEILRGVVEGAVPTCLTAGTARLIRKVNHPGRAIAYVIGDDDVEILVRPCP
jgi:hypothetical protein